MRYTIPRRTGLAAWLLVLLTGSAGFSQQWAKDMFDKTSHNFGTVARGAKVEHTFSMENIYVEDAHIASVRKTCGCAALDYTKGIIKTWEKGKITVQLDTRRFTGRKSSTLTVILDKPFAAEVQLHFYAYIRRDVVVQPGVVQFGTVYQGNTATQSVTVDYAGRSDWQIVKIESANPHLQAKAVETSRIPGQTPSDPGRVTYQLQVTLGGTAPARYIRDHLVLVTNDRDPRASRVPVPVEGIVTPAVTSRPPSLSGVVVEAGESVTERLIVQGKVPFRVLSASCRDERFQCSLTQQTNTLCLINVTFTAGEEAGKVDQIIHIETDRDGAAIDVPVHVRVLPKDPATPQPDDLQ